MLRVLFRSRAVVKFSVPEMYCGGCIASVTQAVLRGDPAAKVAASLTTHLVEVESALSPQRLGSLIEDAGFAAQLVA
jgi:copper chaperone